MSQPSDPLTALPASAPQPTTRPAPVPAPPPRSSLLGCAFTLSFFLNIVLVATVVVLVCAGLAFRGGFGDDATSPVPEKYFSGTRSANDKVAIVTLDGVIMEGMLSGMHKQIEQAAKDDQVKAVVLRINSPGGSITASDDLYRRIVKLRDGDEDRQWAAKPIVVSMGSVAASGGYFIAVPAKKIFAERSTLTGSIGVYASFPNIKDLANKWGISMNTIKAGAIKDSGSMFKDMTPAEQQVVQDMVDDAYVQFLDVVEKGRSHLTRARMLERFTVEPIIPDPKAPRQVPATPYTRYRADGGVFSAIKAKELGLIDSIGPLEDAVVAAAKEANLDDYKAVRYQKRLSFSDLFLNSQAKSTPSQLLDVGRLRALFTPRLWYLAPGYEAAGILTETEPSP